MTEDAVSPVVAAMLILAVIVTFFAAWNAYFVPSMKAQSEITHIRDAESAFLRFSSDIEMAASQKRDMAFSEPIPLGGGDFLFDPVRSGGELNIYNTSPTGYLRINWTSEVVSGSPQQILFLPAFTYKPNGNFWQSQGYGWRNGVVYVFNTERNLTTPLKFTSTPEISYTLPETLVDMEATPMYTSPGNCSSITIRTVNISPDTRHYRVSGNGNGMLTLESSVTTSRVINATSMNLTITSSGNFSGALWDSVNASVDDTLAACSNVGRTLPVDSNRKEIQLTFAATPNLTLIRETTEIVIGAY